MIEPLFSILIAQYNNGEFFRTCYDSIIKQTYNNWEVIIVDDASEDDSVSIMQSIIGDDARFKIIQSTENRGCGYTKRLATEHARGEVCGFLDPDDALAPEALRVMSLCHSENPKASLIYSNNYICDEKLAIKSICHWSKQQPKEVPCYRQVFVCHFATFKRSLYSKGRGINAKLKRAVDIDLYCELEKCGSLLFVNEPLYYYRSHAKGISSFGNRGRAEVWVDVVKILHGLETDYHFEEHFVSEQIARRQNLSLDTDLISTQDLIKEIWRRLIRIIKR